MPHRQGNVLASQTNRFPAYSYLLWEATRQTLGGGGPACSEVLHYVTKWQALRESDTNLRIDSHAGSVSLPRPGVHLHQVWLFTVILGLPNRVRARSRTSADLHSIPKWDQPASGFQVSQDALRGHPAALPADQFVFAPSGTDPQPRKVGPSPVRAVGTILQARRSWGSSTPPARKSCRPALGFRPWVR